MSTTGKARFAAHDATVKTESAGADPADPSTVEGYRPATQAEADYLDMRVQETGNAVRKIKAQIKGLERSLAEAERLHDDAKAAKKAGRDLPDVQKRRAA